MDYQLGQRVEVIKDIDLATGVEVGMSGTVSDICDGYPGADVLIDGLHDVHYFYAGEIEVIIDQAACGPVPAPPPAPYYHQTAPPVPPGWGIAINTVPDEYEEVIVEARNEKATGEVPDAEEQSEPSKKNILNIMNF